MSRARTDSRVEVRRLRSLALCVALSLSVPVAAQASGVSPSPTTSELIAQALAYEHGEGVRKDPRRAAELYCQAARNGDPEAMFSLGWMYANGRGVEHDEAIAASLFARAAQLGNARARQMLAYVGEDRGIVLACMLPAQDDLSRTPREEPVDPWADLPSEKRRIAELVVQAAPSYAIDPQLALAIVAAESNFQPDARSVKDARGVMQLIDKTATRFSVKNRWDARDNIRGGLEYLRWLLAYYEGDVPLAVAAYNSGEAAVDRYRGIPPYRETRDYVRRVLRFYPSTRHPYDPRAVEPSPALGHAPDLSQ